MEDDDQTLQFISILSDYPSLWKKEHKDFMNRDIRKKIFAEIAAQLNITEDDCKKKLKNLKDKMRDVCNKLPKTASGQPAFERGEEIVRWKYYKSLLFMREQFIGRNLSGSLPDDPTEAGTTLEDTDNDNTIDREALNSPPIFELTSPTGRPTRKRSVYAAGTSQQQSVPKKSKQTEMFLQLEKDKIETLKNFMGGSERDEWRAYVESLLHDLRQVKNPYLKVSIKNSISKLVGDTILQQLSMDQEGENQQQQRQQYHESPQQQRQQYHCDQGMSASPDMFMNN